MHLSTAALLLLINGTPGQSRGLFDAAKMNEIVAAETERMTIDGRQVESPEEIEEEVAAIVEFYEDAAVGTEDVNDDFNFQDTVELGGIQFHMAHGDHDDDGMMAAGKSGKASDDMWVQLHAWMFNCHAMCVFN